MPSASTIRSQIESALALKIPAALTPQARMVRPQIPTGVPEVDALLGGGLPIGAVTELVGHECTGRTSLALSFLAQLTQANKVCAWVDASNALDPLSAAGAGVDLGRLLWVRSGELEASPEVAGRRFSLPSKYLAAEPPKKGLHGGGFGPHPRMEIRGMSEALSGLFSDANAEEARPAPSIPTQLLALSGTSGASGAQPRRRYSRARPYEAIERALRSTDLLLQTGGFSAIVLDLGGVPAEFVARIELSTWHRYRVAAEKTQSCILLLTQHPCAKSGSELQLQLLPPTPLDAASTVFQGIRARIEVQRQRFATRPCNILPLRKPVQSVREATWHARTVWAGAR